MMRPVEARITLASRRMMVRTIGGCSVTRRRKVAGGMIATKVSATATTVAEQHVVGVAQPVDDLLLGRIAAPNATLLVTLALLVPQALEQADALERRGLLLWRGHPDILPGNRPAL